MFSNDASPHLSPEHLGTQAIYTHILKNPKYNGLWRGLRDHVDSALPYFSKNRLVDISAGRFHRWAVPGHDPLDVLQQLIKNPVGRGAKDFGHVFITDFFTKDGIPFPGLSKAYLGETVARALRNIGVKSPAAWMNANAFDSFFGIAQIAKGGHNISIALQAELPEFTWQTAWDTFGEGTLSLGFALTTRNPLLLVAGVEQYLAGAIHLYRDLTREAIKPTYIERLMDSMPGKAEVLNALSFFILLSGFKNCMQYSFGSISGAEFAQKTAQDVTVSLGTFVTVKTITNAMALAPVAQTMIVPLLIGAGSSLLFRKVIDLIQESYARNEEEKSRVWQTDPFQVKSPWQADPFKTESSWQADPVKTESAWGSSLLHAGRAW